MKWTKTPPTEPGWYWCKLAPGKWCNYARPEVEAVYVWRWDGLPTGALWVTSAFLCDGEYSLSDDVFAGRLWSDGPLPMIQEESAD